MKKVALLSAFLLIIWQTGFPQIPDRYLGLTPPGNTPEVFAPGVVSLPGRNERVITFSPSGHEMFFAIGNWPTRSTMYIQYKDSAWTTPELASFSVGRSAEEPFFSMDGNRIYYYAYPPNSSTNADIYYSEKTGDAWGDPVNPGPTLNTSGDEFHPNLVSDGSLYFANGGGQTCRAQYSGGSFLPRVLLPDNVNSSIWPDHYVAPDESYMIFTSKMAGGFGNSDLYISFHNADSSWTTPQNFGSRINTSGYEGSADITPDGLYMTYDNISDIYWVKVDNLIDSLKAVSGVISSAQSLPGRFTFNIFPNPGTGLFTVTFPSAHGERALVEISNLDGGIIRSCNLESGATVDIRNARKGIYMVKVSVNNRTSIRKICVE